MWQDHEAGDRGRLHGGMPPGGSHAAAGGGHLPGDPTQRPEGGRGGSCLIAAFAAVFGLGLLLICGGVIYGLATGAAGLSGLSLGPETRTVPTPQDLTARDAAFRAAAEPTPAAETPDGFSPREQRALERLLRGVAAAAAGGDAAAFRRYVDAGRFRHEVEHSPYWAGGVQAWNVTNGAGWEPLLDSALWPPESWTRVRLLKAEPLSGGKEALVYAWMEGYNVGVAVRWWCVRRGAGWLVYDWERADYALRFSDETALALLDPGWVYEGETTRFGQSLATSWYSLEPDDQSNLIDELSFFRQRLASSGGQHPLLQVQALRLEQSRMRPDLARDMAEQWGSPPAAAGVDLEGAAAWAALNFPERALERLDAYERRVGSSPRTWRLEAVALEALGRRSEAAPSWRRLAEFDAEDTNAAASFGAALGPAGREEFSAWLEERRLSAEQLRLLSYSESCTPALLEVLRAHAAEAHAESGLPDYLEGRRWAALGEWRQAEAAFQTAEADADEELREAARQERWDALARQGRALEACEGPQGLEAFGYYEYVYEEGEWTPPPADWSQLLFWRAKQGPHEGWRLLYEGRRHAVLGETAEAEAKFLAALDWVRTEQPDDAAEVESSLRWDLLPLLADSLGAEAWERFGPDESTFSQLAWGFESAGRHDELDRLCQMRTQQGLPRNVWGDLALGRRHAAEGNAFMALNVWATARSGLSDGEAHLASLFLNAEREQRLRQGSPREVCEAEGGAADCLEWLAERLAAAGRWGDLQTLLAEMRSSGRIGDEFFDWEVRADFECGDYAAVRARFSPWPDEAAAPLALWQLNELCGWWVRSLIRQGDFAAAEEAARQAAERCGDRSLPLLVQAAAGDLERLTAAWRELPADQQNQSSLYADPDAGELLYRPEAAALRREFPPGPEWTGEEWTAVLFLPHEAFASDWMDWAIQVLRTDRAVGAPTPSNAPYGGSPSMGDSFDGTLVAVRYHSGRYAEGPPAFNGPASPEAFTDARRVLANHPAHLCVYLCRDPASDYAAPGPAARGRRLLELAREQGVTAAYFPTLGRLALARDFENLPADDASWRRGAGAVGLPVAMAPAIEVRPPEPPSLAVVQDALAGEVEGVPVVVQFVLQIGPFVEYPFLRVERVDWGPYGSSSVVGELILGSHLRPHLAVGSPLRVGWWDVTRIMSPQAPAPRPPAP